MDRWRAAGAWLALAACIACSDAAPTASNQTALDLYDGAPEGCYYNFQHYGEGDRIMTNEPCLNCTCHNRMLMCYLRVCPFTKPIGQDCTVEKRADQCCPIVTCPDVPVDLLTSTSTSSPAEYGSTGLGKLDKYGCSISGKYFPEGSKVPPTPNKPCEHCYCIRNMTTCVMQECTLHVDGCTPIYHKDVCCPVRYSCDHPEDEMLALDDKSTTVRPTPGFLLTTTTISPVTQMTQDCVHNDQIIADGASIATEKACEHCYCMKGDIVCVVQECGAPMENEGKNCTSLPPREGQCCPDTYICEGDEPTPESSPDSPADDTYLEKFTTLSPPRRTGVEGSGYRKEPNEDGITEMPSSESELEGSGDDEEPTDVTDVNAILITGKPPGLEEITPGLEEGDQYIPVTTKAPTYAEPEATTQGIDRNVIPDENVAHETDEPQLYLPTTQPTSIQQDTVTAEAPIEELGPHDATPATEISTPQSYEKITTELVESLNTVPDIPEQEQEKPHKYGPSTTNIPADESSTTVQYSVSQISEGYSEPELTTNAGILDEIEKVTTKQPFNTPELVTEHEKMEPESSISTTSPPTEDRIHPSEEPEIVTPSEILEDKDITGTTISPAEKIERLTTVPDHAQNTVAISEDEVLDTQTHDESTLSGLEDVVTDKITKEDEMKPHEPTSIPALTLPETELDTTEPDKGLNTIPSEINEGTPSSAVDRTTIESQSAESPVEIDTMKPQEVDMQPQQPVTDSSPQTTESHTTKGDQHTITTEPSFRKEDELSVSTEKIKEESGSTTIKAEFIDEGLIPTSSHDDDKINTGADVPSMDEDMTTITPESINDVEPTVGHEEPTIVTAVPGKLPEKVEEIEKDEHVSPSTEQIADVTSSTPEVDTHDEPSRIPGEGDCLSNGVTYTNNTNVPSSDNCHTDCKCVSSIVKCVPIICSPPPDYMDNCQPMYDTADSCCPTYICDHPKDTISPQVDNQMSGTEPPAPHPTIECRGDQCELTESPKEPTEPLACTTGSCITTTDHKPTSECGSQGCEDALIKEPGLIHPPIEQIGCTDGKCKPSLEDCADDSCKLPSPGGQDALLKPCEGDKCKTTTTQEVPTSQLCDNEGNCKTIEVPAVPAVTCEGDACKSNECVGDNCGASAVLPSPENQIPCEGDACKSNECVGDNCGASAVLPSPENQVPCEGEGCTDQVVVSSDCKGEEPCRRKDIPSVEELPPKCEGDSCVRDPVVPISENLGTEIPKLDQIPSLGSTEKNQTDEGKESTESQSSEQDKLDTTPSDENEVEYVHVPTDQPVYEATDAEIKTDKMTEKPVVPVLEETETPMISEQPDDITDQDAMKPDEEVKESELAKPDMISEISTSKPIITEETSSNVPSTVEENITGMPTLEDTTKRDALKDEIDEATGKPLIEEKPSETPDEFTTKPTLVEETSTTDVLDEYHSYKPPKGEDDLQMPEKEQPLVPISEDSTKVPTDNIDVEPTVKPSDEEPIVTVTDSTIEEHSGKPEFIEEEGTKMPDIIHEEPEKSQGGEDKQTDKPDFVEETATTMHDTVEDQTKKPLILEEKETEKPVTALYESTDKTMSEEQGTKKPEPAEIYTNKPDMATEQDTYAPGDTVGEYTDKPTSPAEDTELPNTIKEQTEIPIALDTEITNIPFIERDKPTTVSSLPEDKVTDKPATHDVENKPVLVEEDLPETITPTKGESNETPDLTEIEGTSEISVSEEETTNIPDVDTDSESKKPELIDESTVKPAEGDESIGTSAPTVAQDENVDKFKPSDDKLKPVEEATETTPTEKPLISDKQDETASGTPLSPEFVTEAPEIRTTYLPLEQQTEKTENDIEKETKAPVYEKDETSSESDLEPIDVRKPDESLEENDSITKSPDVPVVPFDIATESLTKLEDDLTTPMPDTISKETLPPFIKDEQELPSQPTEEVTPSQEPLTNAHEPTKTPDLALFTESVMKPIEDKITDEQDNVFTDIPEQQPSATKSPEIVNTEESERPTSPESDIEGSAGEDMTPTEHELDKFTTKEPTILDSPATEIVPDHENTSVQPEPQITEAAGKLDREHTELPDAHDDYASKPTQSTTQESEEDDTKTNPPAIFSPDKEELLTSTVAPAITEPTKDLTGIEDTFETGSEPFVTEHSMQPNEGLEPSAPEKSDESFISTEMPLFSDTKITKSPDEPFTEKHEAQTEATISTDAKPSDKYDSEGPETSTVLSVEVPNTTKPSAPSQDTTQFVKPGDEITETPASDQKIPVTADLATELPASAVSESQETPAVPMQDITSQEEKTTEALEAFKPTGLPDATNEPAIKDTPESHVTASVEPEVTEPSHIEQQITVALETGTQFEETNLPGIEKTTMAPMKPIEPEHTENASSEKPVPDVEKIPTKYPSADEIHTEMSFEQITTEQPLSLVTDDQVDNETPHKAHDSESMVPLPEQEEPTRRKPDVTTELPEMTTTKQVEEITKSSDPTSTQTEFSETTPYLIELEEHTHKMEDDSSTITPAEQGEEYASKPSEETPSSPSDEEDKQTPNLGVTPTSVGEKQVYSTETSAEPVEDTINNMTTEVPLVMPAVNEITTALPTSEPESHDTESHKVPSEETETSTQQSGDISVPSTETILDTKQPIAEEGTKKPFESSTTIIPADEKETTVPSKITDQKDITTPISTEDSAQTTHSISMDSEKLTTSEPENVEHTEKESLTTMHPHIQVASDKTTEAEDELIFATTKATTTKQEEMLTPATEDKYGKPDGKPISEASPGTTAEVPKPPTEMQPTDELPAPEEEGHFPPSGGYGEPDYVEEDQAFGPGTCRYGGKVYVSAQQIPRDDPCDFCFCFRSDIICLQQSCPPPIHGCHEEPIQGFCCPRYECPVSMATTVNVTTTTTTTTTTLPPHFPTHPYKGAAQRRGCQIKGHTYKVGEVVRSSSGPCLHCTCGGDGQMKCDPKACTPEPMLRQMIAAAVSAKRRR